MNTEIHDQHAGWHYTFEMHSLTYGKFFRYTAVALNEKTTQMFARVDDDEASTLSGIISNNEYTRSLSKLVSTAADDLPDGARKSLDQYRETGFKSLRSLWD